MNSKNLVIFALILWASSKFLPIEWTIVVYIALAIFCIYSIIINVKNYREADDSNLTYISNSVDNEKPTKTQLKSNIAINAVFVVLIVGVLCLPLFRSSDSQLKKDIADVNKECPVTIDVQGEKLTFHSVEYDDDYIIVNIQLDSSDPEYVDYVKNLVNTDLQIQATKFGLVYKSPAPYKVLADKYHKGVKANYFFHEIGDARTITIPYDEIISINATSKEDAYLMELESYVNSLNSFLPDTITDGFYTTRIAIEGNNVVTTYSIDDKRLDFQDYISQPEELKKDADNVLAQSANPNDPLFTTNSLAARSNKGIISRFKSLYSNDSIDVIITPEEVRNTFARYLK